MLNGEGRLVVPLRILREEDDEDEFWREREIWLLNGRGEEGVDGADEVFDEMPSSILALRITEWTSDSGPKAKRIISFSPWS